jgi:hypothetical protein
LPASTRFATVFAALALIPAGLLGPCAPPTAAHTKSPYQIHIESNQAEASVATPPLSVGVSPTIIGACG